MVFHNDDIMFVLETVREAGDAAREKQRRLIQTRKKADGSIVTDADLTVQALIEQKLSERFCNAFFIHEEGFSKVPAPMNDHTLCIIIDPIDGTAMYRMGLPEWCVSVGVFQGFTPRYGFVYSPGCGLMFHNDDENAYLNGAVRRVVSEIAIDRETSLFVASEAYRAFHIDFPGKVRNLGSTALQACLIVDNGRNQSIAFIGKSNLWDWAGAIPILVRAGASLRYIDGREVSFAEVMKEVCVMPEYLIAFAGANFITVRSWFIRHEHRR